MILLDTNVVSEPLKLSPDLRVIAWLNEQATETLFLPATALAELLGGVERMPSGKRRRKLFVALEELIETMFGLRVLAFDRSAARVHAELVGRAMKRGTSIAFADCQIAAIAVSNDLVVATRDVSPYQALDVPTIDPWEA